MKRSQFRQPATRLAIVCWLSVVVVVMIDLKTILQTPWLGSDFKPTLLSIGDFVHGNQLNPAFVYPPSAVVLGLPFEALLHHGKTANYLLLLTEIMLLIAGLLGMVNATRRQLFTDPGVALIVLALALSSDTVFGFQLENLSMLLVAATCLFIYFGAKEQWKRAAVVLGLSFAIKPMLFPLLILLLLHRRWAAMLVACAIPVALNLVALPFVQHVGTFLSHAASLSVGRSAQDESNSANLIEVMRVLHVGQPYQTALRVLIGVIVVVVAGQLWTRLRPGVSRDVWVTSVLLAGLLCCTSETHVFYPLVLVPLAFVALDEQAIALRGLLLLGLLLAAWAPAVAGTGATLSWSNEADQCLICFGMLLTIIAATAKLRNASLTNSGSPVRRSLPVEAMPA